jgi:hypothetical protein
MRDWKTLIANPKVQIGAVAALGALIAIFVLLHAAALPPATPPTPPSPAATPAQPAAAGTAAAVPPAEPPKTTARIVFTTVPLTNATVSWGKTRLGVITPAEALVIERPRDSGPLDVVVRAAGYMPVQTRAHTFADTRIVVRLTKPDAKQTLVGYKAPIDAGLDGSLEGTPEVIAPPPFP